MNLKSLLHLPADKKILILGLGTENIQFLSWLINIVDFPLNQILIADKSVPQSLNFELPNSQKYFGENYLDVLKLSEVEYVFKAPGIWSLLPELVEFRNTKGQDRVNSSLVFFFQKFREQIVAITGTKGKSTTSSLTNHLLNGVDAGIQSFYCGNTTGVSPYTFWTQLDQDIDPKIYFVVETSSFQLQDLGFAEVSAKYAGITNYYLDHLDQHKDAGEYWHAKDNIFLYQKPDDILVANIEVSEASKNLKKAKEKTFLVDSDLAIKISSDLDSHLLGDHNKLNLAEAVVIVASVLSDKSTLQDILKYIDENKSIFKQVVADFKPLSHRIELIRSQEDKFKFAQKSLKLKINFYDDGYATEPDAVIAAIKALSSSPNELLWLQLAGKDKGGNLDHLAISILEVQLKEQLYRVDYCGEVGKNILNHIYTQLGVEQELEIEKFRDFVESEFVTIASIVSDVEKYISEKLQNYLDLGAEGKVQEFLAYPEIVLNIVFSPAGSSFDEFKNVGERADWWVRQVREIK
jgi:UDP-N-acetylmuramoylalanine--D-glutamate ligase